MSTGVGVDWIRFRCVFSDPVYGFGWLCGWRADRRAVFDCCVIGWPLEFRGFGVVAGWCLRVGRCRCGPDRFSVLVLWFGPWFGYFMWVTGW